jgi:hypothetical protein
LLCAAWMLWDDLFYVVLAFGIWVIAVWLTFFKLRLDESGVPPCPNTVGGVRDHSQGDMMPFYFALLLALLLLAVLLLVRC